MNSDSSSVSGDDRADSEELFPYRPAVGIAQFGSFKSHSFQRLYQGVGQFSEQHAELVDQKSAGTGSGAEQVELLFLNSFLLLTEQ